MTLNEAAAIHAELLANAAKRDAIREPILAAIRENRPPPPEAYQMQQVLDDDQRLLAIHARVCRDTRVCPAG